MPSKKAPFLIDAHVHTDDKRFHADIDHVLAYARSAGVVAQIVPSVSRNLWPQVKHLCDAHNDLHACYGLHPYFMSEHQESDLLDLSQWLGKERPVAVGECGLDYAVKDHNKQQQQHLFEAQLALAREFSLPIVIHAVRSVDDVIKLIKLSGHSKGLVHSFAGSEQQAYKLIDLGFTLGFGGGITYPTAHKRQATLAKLPLDSFVLETDAPDQPPLQYQGQRNEPAYLRSILSFISELRTETEAQIAKATTENARTLFALK